MSLLVWLPLNGDLHNLGLNGLTFSALDSYCASNNSGKIGKCYNNDAPSWNRGGLRSSTTIDLGQNLSMFCWVNFTTLDSNSSLGGGIISQHRYSTNKGMGLTIKYVSATTGYLSVNTGNGSSRTYNTYCATTLMQAGTWYHVGYTYDGTTLKLYVNGKVEKTLTISGMNVPAEYLTVFCWSMDGSSGSGVYTAHFKLNGKINDVRVYDHCLSPKEVEEIAKGLVLHYKLDEQTFEETFDFDAGYLPLEYITTVGNVYFQLPSIFNLIAPNNYKVTFEPTSTNTTINTVFSAYAGSSNYCALNYTYGGTNVPYGIMLRTSSASNYTSYPVVGRQLIKYMVHILPGGRLTIYQGSSTHGITVSSLPSTSSGFSSANSIYLFSLPGTSLYFIGKFYEFLVLNGNTITEKYIPVIRTMDNAIGIYGINNKTFIAPIGSKANITAGPVINSTANTIVYDSSGYSNNGTSVGYMRIIQNANSSRYQNCTYIELGSLSYINTPSLNLSNSNITLNIWFKSSTQPVDSYHTLFTSLSNRLWYEMVIGSSGVFRAGLFVDGTRQVANCASAKGLNNQWHMYTLTYDGITIRRYVDGIQESVTNINITGEGLKTPVTLRIGHDGTSTYSCKLAYLSDARIYATALSPAAILELYNNSASIDNNGNIYIRELVEE